MYPILLYQYIGREGTVFAMERLQEGFRLTTTTPGGTTRFTLPFAEGDKLAIATRPGFDPARDDPEAIATAEEAPFAHDDD